MSTRRSFLAAVMGAIGASAINPKVGPLSLPEGAFALTGPGEWLRHYSVWDSVTISPGSIVSERFLPPPVPKDFSITSMGLHFNAEAPYKSVAAVAQKVRFAMTCNGLSLMEGPLFGMPIDQPGLLLAVPFVAKGGDDLGLFLHSDGPVSSLDPVTVCIILNGVVRA